MTWPWRRDHGPKTRADLSSSHRRRVWFQDYRYLAYTVVGIHLVFGLPVFYVTLAPPQTRQEFSLVNALSGPYWWVLVVHWVIAGIICLGLIRTPWRRYTEWGFLISIMMFNTIGMARLVTGIRTDTSLSGAAVYVAFSVVSFVAMRAPKPMTNEQLMAELQELIALGKLLSPLQPDNEEVPAA